MAVQLYGCAAVWLCSCMAVQRYGYAAVWLCSCMAVQLYGCAAVWLCSCMAVQLSLEVSVHGARPTRRASGRAAQKPGGSDPVLSAVRPRASRRGGAGGRGAHGGASDRAALRPGPGVVTRCRASRGRGCGVEDREWRPGTHRCARARMSRRGRLGRRGAAGRRRTGPAEMKSSSDGRGALTDDGGPRVIISSHHSMGAERSLITSHQMMADMQQHANIPSDVSGVHMRWGVA
jgi:hypothetical protein